MPKLPHNKILHTILKQAEDCRNSASGVKQRLFAIFDLDSTLFDVQPRIAKILKEFTHDPRMIKLYPEEIAVLKSAQKLPNFYYMREILTELGLVKQTPEFYRTIFDFWKDRFFTDDYLKHDTPYPGAVKFVQELSGHGAEILYLTGRDVPRMGKGTRRGLERWNFPLDDQRSKLELKPHHAIDDAEFKRDHLIPYQSGHGPIWFFENELANIELILKASPHIGIVFFDSIHSGKGAPIPPHVPVIKDFLLV